MSVLRTAIGFDWLFVQGGQICLQSLLFRNFQTTGQDQQKNTQSVIDCQLNESPQNRVRDITHDNYIKNASKKIANIKFEESTSWKLLNFKLGMFANVGLAFLLSVFVILGEVLV